MSGNLHQSQIPPPNTEGELQARAQALAGMTLGDLAARLEVALPENLRRAKGFVGQLIELALGADAGVKALPDFVGLGIELKTLPLNTKQQPQESTYVCTLPLQLGAMAWEQSVVYAKLARVLWVPVQAERTMPLAERKIGVPILWSPDTEEEEMLRQDWEEITDYILHGELDKLDASIGQALHVRPKAMHGKALSWTIDAQGDKVPTLPRGFYLRQSFTRMLVVKMT